MRKIVPGLLALFGVLLWAFSGVVGKSLGRKMFLSVEQPELLAILLVSVLMFIFLGKANTPAKRIAMLIWWVSASVFGVLLAWYEYHGLHGQHLIGWEWDEYILVCSFLGILFGCLLRLSVLQFVLSLGKRIITLVFLFCKRIFIWVKTGSFCV